MLEDEISKFCSQRINLLSSSFYKTFQSLMFLEGAGLHDMFKEYCISHYFRVQLFSRFWTFAVIREWLISRFL